MTKVKSNARIYQEGDPLPGDMTIDRIGVLKKKAKGPIFHIIVNDGFGEEKVGWYKRPSFEAMQASMDHAENNPMESGLILFNDCWLDGDEEIQTDGAYKAESLKKLMTLFTQTTSEIKKY